MKCWALPPVSALLDTAPQATGQRTGRPSGWEAMAGRVNLPGFADVTRNATVVADETSTLGFAKSVTVIALEGIEAVGSGKHKRRAVVGAVSSFRAARIAETAIMDAFEVIEGREPMLSQCDGEVDALDHVRAHALLSGNVKCDRMSLSSFTARNTPSATPSRGRSTTCSSPTSRSSNTRPVQQHCTAYRSRALHNPSVRPNGVNRITYSLSRTE